MLLQIRFHLFSLFLQLGISLTQLTHFLVHFAGVFFHAFQKGIFGFNFLQLVSLLLHSFKTYFHLQSLALASLLQLLQPARHRRQQVLIFLGLFSFPGLGLRGLLGSHIPNIFLRRGGDSSPLSEEQTREAVIDQVCTGLAGICGPLHHERFGLGCAAIAGAGGGPFGTLCFRALIPALLYFEIPFSKKAHFKSMRKFILNKCHSQLSYLYIWMGVVKKYLVIYLVQALLIAAGTKEIFIDYGQGGDGQELFKLFNGVDDKFFVDIGAFDAIYISNTLNLHVNGWTGINIEASPKRLAPFLYLRPEDANLNIAVGENDVFVTLYDLKQDSASTVSNTVKDKAAGSNPVQDEVKIPSISMKELCKRFYYRQPTFLSLDIEGMGAQAVLGNDWKDKRCRPEIMFSEANQLNDYSGFPLPSEVLTKEGYKLSPVRVGANEVFIEESLFQKYQKRREQNSKILEGMEIHLFKNIANQLALQIKITTALRHYDPKSDGMYYHFAIKNRPLILSEIAKSSILIASNKNSRPIAVFHYNPLYSKIIVPHDNYALSSVTTKGGYKFHSITVKEADGSSYSVYIFDHQYTHLIGPQIVSLDSGKVNQVSYVSEETKIPTFSLFLNIFACLVIVWLTIEGILTVMSRRRQVRNQIGQVSYESESVGDSS